MRSLNSGQKMSLLRTFKSKTSSSSNSAFHSRHPLNVSVDKGRASTKMRLSDASRFLSSPATNCRTTCHAPCVILLWTNFRSCSSLLVSATYLAARNSWMVRCIKQNWALGFSNGLSAEAHKSGRRWSRPQSSNPLTSLDSKISLPSFIPLKAIFPSRLKSAFTPSGRFSNFSRMKSAWPWYCL